MTRLRIGVPLKQGKCSMPQPETGKLEGHVDWPKLEVETQCHQGLRIRGASVW